MKVTWILSQDIPKDLLDPAKVKTIAESWGSWTTWKEYKTENCVCTDAAKAATLIKRAFHAVTNLYLLQADYVRAGSPSGVKLFNGEFKNSTISNKDDLVALNIAVPTSDIVLLSGFDFSPILNTDDKAIRASREEYYFNVRNLIQTNAETQFVLVDYKHELSSWISELDNITQDTVESVTSLLGQ